MKPFADSTYIQAHPPIVFHGHFCAVCGNGPMPKPQRMTCRCGAELHKRAECRERHVCPKKGVVNV